MQLFYSALSPFACKVRVCAYELGVHDRFTLTTASGWTDESFKATNPLGQIPALVLEDGTVLYDSAVICDFLNELVGGSLIPPSGPTRWAALTRQALADGLCDAGVRIVRERLRDVPNEDVTAAMMRKLVAGLAVLERDAPLEGFGIGEAAVACGLVYFDAREIIDWRPEHPKLAAWFETASRRDSLVSTSPQIAKT